MSEEKMSAGAEAAINEVKRRSAAYREMVAKTAVVESFSSIDPDGTRMTTQITTWQTEIGVNQTKMAKPDKNLDQSKSTLYCEKVPRSQQIMVIAKNKKD